MLVSLLNLLLRVNVIPDFMCMAFMLELRGAESKQKLYQMKKNTRVQ